MFSFLLDIDMLSRAADGSRLEKLEVLCAIIWHMQQADKLEESLFMWNQFRDAQGLWSDASEEYFRTSSLCINKLSTEKKLE